MRRAPVVTIPMTPDQGASSGDRLSYTVDLTQPGHEVLVSAAFPLSAEGDVELYMPRWAPGSYLIREFARMVNSIAAEQDGRPLSIEKTSTDGWTVRSARPGELVIRYALHAHELTVRTNYLGPDRALLAGAATYIVPAGSESSAARVRVVVPPDWPAAACPLAQQDGWFLARDFDALVDAPIAAGPCRSAEFTLHGVPHRVLVHGQGDTDPARLADACRRIATAAASLFGDSIPCASYLFFIQIDCGGGLEHADSSVCGFPALTFSRPAEARRALSLVAHEYFHLWNIKRIRPRGLGPFDYRREAHVPHLWVAEGFTSYYQHLLCLRAGLITPGRFLATMAAHLFEAEATTGQRFQSLRDSSHDAWTKYYRPHENSSNVQVSYYGKGALAGMVLDLEIRRRTGGERGLDDAFRELWRMYRETGAGFDDAMLRDALATAAGERLDDVVDEVAMRAEILDAGSRLRAAGLDLVRRPGPPGGFLGIVPRAQDGALIVDRVLRDGPAWHARLSPGEEIVALDGWRVNEQRLRARLDAMAPGDRVELTSVLAGRLRTSEVRLAARPSQDYRVHKARTATAAERQVARAWLGVSWEALEPLDEIHEELRAGRGPRPA